MTLHQIDKIYNCIQSIDFELRITFSKSEGNGVVNGCFLLLPAHPSKVALNAAIETVLALRRTGVAQMHLGA